MTNAGYWWMMAFIADCIAVAVGDNESKCWFFCILGAIFGCLAVLGVPQP